MSENDQEKMSGEPTFDEIAELSKSQQHIQVVSRFLENPKKVLESRTASVGWLDSFNNTYQLIGAAIDKLNEQPIIGDSEKAELIQKTLSNLKSKSVQIREVVNLVIIHVDKIKNEMDAGERSDGQKDIDETVEKTQRDVYGRLKDLEKDFGDYVSMLG